MLEFKGVIKSEGLDSPLRHSKTIDGITRHLKLTFEAERPPSSRVVQQDLLMAAEEKGEYF